MVCAMYVLRYCGVLCGVVCASTVMCCVVWCELNPVCCFPLTAPRFTSSGRESLVDQYQGKVDEAKERQRRLDQERGTLEEEKSELQEKLSKAEVRQEQLMSTVLSLGPP